LAPAEEAGLTLEVNGGAKPVWLGGPRLCSGANRCVSTEMTAIDAGHSYGVCMTA
jgi:hypothetical protein